MSPTPTPAPRHPNAGKIAPVGSTADCNRVSDDGNYSCALPDLHGGSCWNQYEGSPAAWVAANAARGFGTPTCAWNTTVGGPRVTKCGHPASTTRGPRDLCDYHSDRYDAKDYAAGPVPAGWTPSTSAAVPPTIYGPMSIPGGMVSWVRGFDVPAVGAVRSPEPKCECGAAKIGAKPYSPAHARWCEVSA